ncbi:type II secretion system secretin GspD [Photobacterium iliopiscarium]|uniref:Type II secretion system protein GspD n=1 Tax=Photobacterium iliopiscarium TaxID=56192 RepID=A0A2T3M9B9_9GAMM|nr:type II secretion system secretin GspD [Photobacterium iliopiscarium]KJG13295.1 general secretion pathway protein GspD [Photobacterium iliopiscarium]PST92893.1 type II secretion system protein GspD [Photobacterium iliopiscarium]PST98587.1 type II secretion system protein GspD [Photobacterium iliopiscarium]PSV81138.1 type II secretion system protein GspD [Photobacterium iliopiscarium]PSV89043.1 type II secretion system protein GspD [Photobacterium iliopiscarium]
MKKWMGKSALLLLSSLFCSQAMADELSANFKGTDIQEFINIVGRTLHKTIIIDPAVRGQVNVRSYDLLNEEQYYRFFLNVLDVYGYAVVTMEDGVMKVIRDKDAKTAAIPVVDANDKNIPGDAVVTRVIAVKNVSVRELSPLLRQLNDNAGAGNVVHYDPANIIMITGRAAVVNRLAEIIERVDRAGNKDVTVVSLNNASASEMVRIIDSLNKSAEASSTPGFLIPKAVADERTNSVLISGDPKVRERLKNLIHRLDKEMAVSGNSRVFYLKYAKAEDLVDVLKGVSENVQASTKGNSGQGKSTSKDDVMISAHAPTNSLIISAPADVMKRLESIISQLDIRRAQVHIEAMIVEVQEGDGVNLGVQWGSEDGGVIQFGNSGAPIGGLLSAQEQGKDKVTTQNRTDPNTGEQLPPIVTTETGDLAPMAAFLGGVKGAAAAIALGDWTALVTAVQSNRNVNVLSTPNITVLDNQEANLSVGQEVPVTTGSQTGSNNDNPFTTVERKDVGIQLKVTPQINEGDSVQMKIEQVVSQVADANGAVDIRFDKRELSTSVLVKDGNMIALGGLMQEKTLESEQKVPILGDIPVLGALFRSTNNQTEKTNLMIFIRPTILRDGMSADGMTQRKYNYIRAQQLYQADKGMRLMDVDMPVIPKYGDDMALPAEVRAFVSQLEKH